MNGWSSRVGADRWDDEPAWVYEITWEWEPVEGQRYPGDPGRRRAVHTPVYEASRGKNIQGIGRASVVPPPGSLWSVSEEQERYGRREEPPWPETKVQGATAQAAPRHYPPEQRQPRERTLPDQDRRSPDEGDRRFPDREDPRAATPPPAQRAEPSWNRPVPLPKRLPGARSAGQPPEPLAPSRAPEPRRAAPDGRPQPVDRRMQPPATDVPHYDLPGDQRHQGDAGHPGFEPPTIAPRSATPRPAPVSPQHGPRSSSPASAPPDRTGRPTPGGPIPASPPYGPARGSHPYGQTSGSPAYGPASGSPAYGPASGTPAYGPASGPPAYGPAGTSAPNGPVGASLPYGPAAVSPSHVPRPASPAYGTEPEPADLPRRFRSLRPPAPDQRPSTPDQRPPAPDLRPPAPDLRPPTRDQAAAYADPQDTLPGLRDAHPERDRHEPRPEDTASLDRDQFGANGRPPAPDPALGQRRYDPLTAEAPLAYRPRRSREDTDPYGFTWAPPTPTQPLDRPDRRHSADPVTGAPYETRPIHPAAPVTPAGPLTPPGPATPAGPVTPTGPVTPRSAPPSSAGVAAASASTSGPAAPTSDYATHDTTNADAPEWSTPSDWSVPSGGDPAHDRWFTDDSAIENGAPAGTEPGAYRRGQDGDDGLAWIISAGPPGAVSGDVITGEIVDGDVSGEIIRAEVVAAGAPSVPPAPAEIGPGDSAPPADDRRDGPAADGWDDWDRADDEPTERLTDPAERATREEAMDATRRSDATPADWPIVGTGTGPAPSSVEMTGRPDIDAPQATEAEATTDPDSHGLGWLLEISGLGAVTPGIESDTDEPEDDQAVAESEAQAQTPATSEADDRPTTPVSAAPVAGDWFAPRADAEPTDAETADAETADAETADAETADPEPAGAETASGERARAERADAWPARAKTADPQPARTEPAEPAETNTADAATAETTTAETRGAETRAAEPADTTAAEPDPAVAQPAAMPARADRDAIPADTAPTTAEAATVPKPTAPDTSSAAEPRHKTDQQRDTRDQGTAPDSEPEPRLVDPEQILAAYPWRFDPTTLRELVDDRDRLRAVRDRLTDKLEYAERDSVRARLLSLRAVASRVLGDHNRALADGRRALTHAEATGELRRTAIAAARLAHVHQWRGEYAEADKLFAEANSVELPDRLRAEMSEHAGRSAFEQGRYFEALKLFEEALNQRRGEDEEMSDRVAVALDVVYERVRETKDWGPYSRTRDEILQRHPAPVPEEDDRTELWGFGEAIPPRYREVRPFHEGVAWVRRPDATAWELIDESGAVVIDASSAYAQVTDFAESLAWVTRSTAGGGWFAIDRTNREVIGGGFDDVRPFRRGLAVVRRGAWGAVDRLGGFVVQPKYRAFATALTDGQRIEGFTDEGLAIVDAGERLGVVDRAGRLLVAPVHAALRIHPVAYLIGDNQGRWGALDRRGDPLIDVVHPRPSDVTQEIDRLLADTRPVL